MKTIKIGIMSRQDFRQYTIDIAKGTLKPAFDSPKIWFDSVESMSGHGIVKLEKGSRNATIPHVLADSFEVAAFA